MSAMTAKELIKALEATATTSNELDIAIEIALFDPPISVEANSTGTKLIYTLRSGKKETCWAGDHTLGPERRARSIALLKALKDNEPSHD